MGRLSYGQLAIYKITDLLGREGTRFATVAPTPSLSFVSDLVRPVPLGRDTLHEILCGPLLMRARQT